MENSITNLARDVALWNFEAGQLEGVKFLRTSPQESVLKNPIFNKQKDMDLAIDIVREEVDELEEALQNQDFTETIDAVCDIIFTALGAAAKAGIPSTLFEEAMQEVIRSNNSKFDGEREVLPSGKFGKGSEYSPPDLPSIIETYL